MHNVGNNMMYRRSVICMREKNPLTDILVKYVFELKRTCPNYWGKKFVTWPKNLNYSGHFVSLHFVILVF